MRNRPVPIRPVQFRRLVIVLVALVVASACTGKDDASAITGPATANVDVPDSAPPGAEIVDTDTEQVTVRPVIACDVEIQPDTALGQEMLATRDGYSCVVGRIANARSVFERATVSLDGTQGTWGIDVDVRPDAREYWDEVVAECFTLTGGCPSGQIAIVLGKVVQVTPAVLSPDLGNTLRISGDYTEQEARAVAAIVNGDAANGEASG